MTTPQGRQCTVPMDATDAPLPVPRAVLLVDDQPDFLRLARELLGGHVGIRVVGEATSGEEALALIPALAADVVVLDVEMPGMHGFETARRLLAAAPRLAIVMVSNTNEPQYAQLARAVGARAFLAKHDFSARALIHLLEA
jgi:DNA-binding NarL/FixJ family response regulator